MCIDFMSIVSKMVGLFESFLIPLVLACYSCLFYTILQSGHGAGKPTTKVCICRDFLNFFSFLLSLHCNQESIPAFFEVLEDLEECTKLIVSIRYACLSLSLIFLHRYWMNTQTCMRSSPNQQTRIIIRDLWWQLGREKHNACSRMISGPPQFLSRVEIEEKSEHSLI